MSEVRCVDVRLTIPDNAARTALATLRGLGVAIGGLERAELYRCTVDAGAAAGLAAALRGIETIYNPSKHELRERASDAPAAGEVWIAEDGEPIESGDAVRIAGRSLPGVRRIERLTAWRVLAAAGEPAGPELVDLATTTLLCNPAFQKATRA